MKNKKQRTTLFLLSSLLLLVSLEAGRWMPSIQWKKQQTVAKPAKPLPRKAPQATPQQPTNAWQRTKTWVQSKFQTKDRGLEAVRRSAQRAKAENPAYWETVRQDAARSKPETPIQQAPVVRGGVTPTTRRAPS